MSINSSVIPSGYAYKNLIHFIPSILQSLFNKIGITDYDNSLVTVYLVGNKNTSISEVLDIKNIKEI